MSTVAYDGRYLAADTQASDNGQRSLKKAMKIASKNGIAYGSVGVMGVKDVFIQWYEAGADPKSMPPHGFADNDLGNFIVIKAGKCMVYSWMWPYPQEEIAPMAWGSGAQYALGAMVAGANAIKAVECAIKLDLHSGGQVDVIDLERLLLKDAAA